MIEIISFCAQNNIPIDYQSIQTVTIDGQYFSWNGKGLSLLYQPWGICPRPFSKSSLWHDIGHWLIASPEQRQEPSLGIDEADELSASIIGIELHKHIGGDRYAKEKRFSGPMPTDPTGRAEKILKELL